MQHRIIVPRNGAVEIGALDPAPASYTDKNGVYWAIFDRGGGWWKVYEATYIAHSYGYKTEKDLTGSMWGPLRDEIDEFAGKNKSNKKDVPFTGLPGGIKLPPIAGGTSPVSGAIPDDPNIAIPAASAVFLATVPKPTIIGSGTTAEKMLANLRHVVLAIGWLENHFGLSPAWMYKDSSGKDVPSYNWGAIGWTPGDLFTEKPDKDKYGKLIMRKVAVFASMRDGLIGFLKKWDRPATHSFAEDGDAWSVADQMFAFGYYTGVEGTPVDRIYAYAKAIDGAARFVAGVLGEKTDVFLKPPASVAIPPPKASDKPSGSGIAIAAGIGVVGLGLWALFKR